MIDSIYILSLEHDKPRRQRLLSLIRNESDKSLIDKVKIVKGAYHPQINDNFLRANKLDYYRNWTLSKEEAKNIISAYGEENDISIVESFYCQKLKKGQIATLIGHIECWKQMILNNDEYALIFEDDAWWPSENCLSSELGYFFSLNPDFDIFYLGRNPLLASLEESWNVDPKYVIPRYSYNNQSYVFSRQGALKALMQNPHKNLMSSDEFLPACYDDHPREDIRKVFKKCLKPLALRGDKEFIWQQAGEGISQSNIAGSSDID